MTPSLRLMIVSACVLIIALMVSLPSAWVSTILLAVFAIGSLALFMAGFTFAALAITGFVERLLGRSQRAWDSDVEQAIANVRERHPAGKRPETRWQGQVPLEDTEEWGRS